MTPPYKMVDQATGEVARGPNGEAWENMDVAPGGTMELYDTSDDSKPWPRVSPSELVRPDGTDPGPDPGPEPIPPTPGNGMDTISNERELKDALQTYANEQRVGSCGSRTAIEITAPIEIQQHAHDGFPWGVNLNFTRLLWKGEGGKDVLTYRGTDGISNRGLFIEKVCIDGNGYAAAPAGRCVHIYAPDGDPGSIYKFTLRDIFTCYATEGIAIRGAVFEGLLDNVHAENHRRDGIIMESLGLDGMSPWSIVSNIMIVHPNSSRNMGAGMRQPYSVNSLLGSYVLNAEGGIVSGEGIRCVIASNGENTGEQLLVPGYNGYGTLISGNEASSDGKTHARAYQDGGWVSVGKPMLYGVNDVGHYDTGNHFSYYGDGSAQTSWTRPGGKAAEPAQGGKAAEPAPGVKGTEQRKP
jgi:hypothetical protein